MKIICNTPNRIAFKELRDGDVFEDANGNICMKCEVLVYGDANIFINSVNLEDGSFKYFNSEILVKPINCELIIEK